MDDDTLARHQEALVQCRLVMRVALSELFDANEGSPSTSLSELATYMSFIPLRYTPLEELRWRIREEGRENFHARRTQAPLLTEVVIPFLRQLEIDLVEKRVVEWDLPENPEKW
jgi:hypothetical protein